MPFHLSSKFKVQSSKLRSGFTLVELLVVITIFVLASTLVLAGYLTFERNQRLKNAASQLKGDIRLVQNNALSGNKGNGGDECLTDSSHMLGGWYLEVQRGLSEYYLRGLCYTIDPVTGFITDPFATPTFFKLSTIRLPKDVVVSRLLVGSTEEEDVDIIFQPLARKTVNTVLHSCTNFLNADLTAKCAHDPDLPLTIELSLNGVLGTYQVIVQPSGEVNESKP